MKKILIYIALFAALPVIAQNSAPEWSKDQTIYEVNIRQYTPEGTFDAFTQHIPRLEELGVGILWVMPVQPIGKLNRKGSLGSYYSISDYTATNPEFGSMNDFKKMVREAHQHHMRVILDWVGNHTSWDNVWMKDHKDYYTTDKNGKIVPPVADWADVADLNYDNKNMRAAMIDAMKFWLTEGDVDGFRCDVAMMIPDDFWQEAIPQLKKIKPDLFMLCEAEGTQFIKDGFNMDYGWARHHDMNMIAQGKMEAQQLDSLVMDDINTYPKDAYFMNFTSNHDENTWNGTEFERMGNAAKTFAVVSATLPGMLLVYSGQEVGFNKRLRFFDKDTITWLDDKNFTPFYQTLINAKKDNSALWNGAYGGSYRRVLCDYPGTYIYVRENETNKVLVVLNLSSEPRHIVFYGESGTYKNIFTGKKEKVKGVAKMDLQPWEYRVLVK